MSQEIWKAVPIQDYEVYEVSSCGNVRNTRTGRILQAEVTKRGYVRHTMSVGGKTKRVQAHRLVAEAFVCNSENKRYVNHIDGNKNNNHIDNLEWVTQSENQHHAVRTGLQAVGSATSYAKLCEDDIIVIRRLVVEGVSRREIAKRYNVTEALISMIHLRKWWKHVPDETPWSQTNSR